MKRCLSSGFIKRYFVFLCSIFLLSACVSDYKQPKVSDSKNKASIIVSRYCNQSSDAQTLRSINTSEFVCRQNIKVGFDIHGNGIVVREVEKEKRILLVYSLFDSAKKIWSKDAELTRVENVNSKKTFNHVVTSKGQGFSVRWKQSTAVKNDEYFDATFSSASLKSIKRIESVDGYSLSLHKLITQLKNKK